MSSYLPEFLLNSPTFKSVYDAEMNETADFEANIQDLVNQCFIETATWGLSFWEEFLGLTTDTNLSYTDRRSIIRAKVRSSGTTTISRIKNVAESYQNGTVDILEDPTNYTVTIKFISTIGIPPNISALQSAISQIIPAHLYVNYQYLFNTYATVHNFKLGTLEGYTWDEIRATNISTNFTHARLGNFTHAKVGEILG